MKKYHPDTLRNATEEEKQYQIEMLNNLHEAEKTSTKKGIKRIQEAAVNNQNIFEELMEICKHASLGQVTHALFEVGGQYRRNM